MTDLTIDESGVEALTDAEGFLREFVDELTWASLHETDVHDQTLTELARLIQRAWSTLDDIRDHVATLHQIVSGLSGTNIDDEEAS